MYIETESHVANDHATLATFLNTAFTHGVRVELLSGDANWALTANHGEVLTLTANTVAFY